MKVALPAQIVPIQLRSGAIEPIWYDRLNAMVNMLNSGAIGQPTLPANATTGFGYLPLIAGAPTGVPVMPAGYVAVCVSLTGPSTAKLWCYTGTAWESTNLT